MLYGLEAPTIELHGQPVTYYRAGQGPPILLVHGITLQRSHLARSHARARVEPRGDRSRRDQAVPAPDRVPAADARDRAGVAGGHSLGIPAGRPGVTLPPGQHPVGGFPRFGTHLGRPAPAVPIDPVIKISGAVAKSFALPLAELATLPRRELTADFHCVAGWSATDLHWEGVAFETFYRRIIEPSVQADTEVTHVVFGGLDGYRSVASIEDALAEDVLIAEHLDGVRSTPTMARRPDWSAPTSTASSAPSTSAASNSTPPSRRASTHLRRCVCSSPIRGSAMNPATANARSTRSGPPDALDLGPRPGYGRRVN